MRRRIADLGQKVEFLEGASEFRMLRARILREAGGRLDAAEFQRRLRLQLQQRAYANAIGVDPTQWARIKIGTDPVKDHQLSALATQLDLDEFGGIELWTLPMAEFQATLREKGYGKFGGPGGMADLAARLRALAIEAPAIRIVVVGGAVVAGANAARGIGDPDDVAALPVLQVGQRVRLEIGALGAASHLVVLSEDPGRRLVVLGRNGAGLQSCKEGEAVLLPSATATYPVGKPLGRHTLYAVAFSAKPTLPSVLEESGTGTGTLTAAGTSALIAALGSAEDAVRVGLLDYRVD